MSDNISSVNLCSINSLGWCKSSLWLCVVGVMLLIVECYEVSNALGFEFIYYAYF